MPRDARLRASSPGSSARSESRTPSSPSARAPLDPQDRASSGRRWRVTLRRLSTGRVRWRSERSWCATCAGGPPWRPWVSLVGRRNLQKDYCAIHLQDLTAGARTPAPAGGGARWWRRRRPSAGAGRPRPGAPPSAGVDRGRPRPRPQADPTSTVVGGRHQSAFRKIRGRGTTSASTGWMASSTGGVTPGRRTIATRSGS